MLCAGDVGQAGPRTEKIEATHSTSFACDLRKWLQIMEAYEQGGYRTTPPCLPMRSPCLRDVMMETAGLRFRQGQGGATGIGRQGPRVPRGRVFRALPPPASSRRASSSATRTIPTSRTGRSSAAQGLQTAAGVPLQCDEPADFRTFRIG